MTFASFTDLIAETHRRRDAQGEAATIDLFEAHVEAFPLHRALVLLNLAAAYTQVGRNADALAALDRALAAGCRFKREWLLHDARLAPLHESERFVELVGRFDARYSEDAARAQPELKVDTPSTAPGASGYPLLVVLHGNNSDMSETLPYWRAATALGWVLAVPQSSEIGATPGAFTWNDRERTATEVREHIDRIASRMKIDRGRVVLAGFSMGGLQAIALPIARLVEVRGVIPVAAWLPHIREFTKLVESGSGHDLRAYVVVGEDDPSAEGARQLVALLDRHGAKVTLDARAGLGHEYPKDMAATLERALSAVG